LHNKNVLAYAVHLVWSNATSVMKGMQNLRQLLKIMSVTKEKWGWYRYRLCGKSTKYYGNRPPKATVQWLKLLRLF